MAILFENYWWVFLVALLLGVAIAWWVFVINARANIADLRTPDVLDEGAGPAKRNQALIDAPPMADQSLPATPDQKTKIPAAAPSSDMPLTAKAPDNGPDHVEPGDDLMRIKGIGPKLNSRLIELGVHSYAEIASWDENTIDQIDAQLGNFQGRIRRDNWIEQARYLANKDTEGFEARFGKL